MPQQVPAQKIDQLLFGLKVATDNLHESLKSVCWSDTPAAPHCSRNSKRAIVSVLMQEVERRYGVTAGEQIERKLLRIFDPMNVDDLECWSRCLLSPDVVEAEWLLLMECLTVHETYFDRDSDQLGVLFSDVLPRLIEQKRQSGDHRLRIWSAGCSSGEETYNLAMLTLMAMKCAGCATELEDGSIVPLSSWSVAVLGSDLSTQMLRTAKDGCYATLEMGSFRNMDPHLWRFFDETEIHLEGAHTVRTMRVKRCISDVTRFKCHNLLEPVQHDGPFDLIVCRNVMIYFNGNNKRLVQEKLCGSLDHGGALMLGATDTLVCGEILEQHQHNGNFWYVKK